jgi:hypothetical protein
MFWETSADQYGTWAHGVSWLPAAPGRPNLLGIASPALVVVSVAVPGVLVLRAGLNGRAIGLAKLGAPHLHPGRLAGTDARAAGLGGRVDQGRQRHRPLPHLPVRLVEPTRHRPSQRLLGPRQPRPVIYLSPHHNLVLVRFGTDYHHYDHWPDLLATLARRLRT